MNLLLEKRLENLYRKAKECMSDKEMNGIEIAVDVPSKPGLSIFSFDFNHGEPEVGIDKNNGDEPMYCLPIDMFSDEIIGEVLVQVKLEVEEKELEMEKVFDRNKWGKI